MDVQNSCQFNHSNNTNAANAHSVSKKLLLKKSFLAIIQMVAKFLRNFVHFVDIKVLLNISLKIIFAKKYSQERTIIPISLPKIELLTYKS